MKGVACSSLMTSISINIASANSDSLRPYSLCALISSSVSTSWKTLRRAIPFSKSSSSIVRVKTVVNMLLRSTISWRSVRSVSIEATSSPTIATLKMMWKQAHI